MNVFGEIVVQPNPATEGGTVTITLPHDGPWFVRRNGSTDDWEEITGVDPDSNTVTIDVPAPAGGAFTISDNRVPDGNHLSVNVNGAT
jgi:hypothetical protein